MNKENISNRVDKLETAVNAAASGVLNLEEQLKLADKRQQELAAKQVDMEAAEKQQQAVSGIISNSRLKKDQAELMLLKWKYPELLVPEIQLLDSLYEVDGDIDIKESFIHSNK